MVARAAKKLPGLRALPLARLLALAEVMIVAREHITRLDPAERRRLVELVRIGRGTRRLSSAQREELRALVAKLETGTLARDALSRITGLPLGPRGKRPQ